MDEHTGPWSKVRESTWDLWPVWNIISVLHTCTSPWSEQRHGVILNETHEYVKLLEEWTIHCLPCSDLTVGTQSKDPLSYVVSYLLDSTLKISVISKILDHPLWYNMSKSSSNTMKNIHHNDFLYGPPFQEWARLMSQAEGWFFSSVSSI